MVSEMDLGGGVSEGRLTRANSTAPDEDSIAGVSPTS